MNASRTQYRPNPDVICTDLDDGEAVLLNIITREYYTLNATGRQIWQCVSEGRELTEAVTALSTSHEVDREVADQFVREYVEELTTEGLLIVDESTAD